MFSAFKAKLSAVKKDVTTSLKTVGTVLPVSLSNRPRSAHHSSNSSLSDQGADLLSSQIINDNIHNGRHEEVFHSYHDAAQELLHRYESTWEEMCKVTDSNVKKAKTLNSDLHSVQGKIVSTQHKHNELENEICKIPTMLAQIQEITNQITDLHSSCALLEDSLISLENLCEESELQRAKLGEEDKLALYEVRKAKDHTAYSGKLAHNHKKKVVAYELRQAEVRRTKELFYQNAFEEDIKRFKAEQKLKETKQLSEISLDPDQEDESKLEQFLQESPDEVDSLNPSISQTTMSSTAKPRTGDMPDNHTSEDTDVGVAKDADMGVSGDGATDRIMSADLVLDPGPPRERSDTEQSNQHILSSSDSLEWDENGDELDIVTEAIGDNSLETEINDIIRKSTENLSQSVEHSSDNELNDDQQNDDQVVHK